MTFDIIDDARGFVVIPKINNDCEVITIIRRVKYIIEDSSSNLAVCYTTLDFLKCNRECKVNYQGRRKLYYFYSTNKLFRYQMRDETCRPTMNLDYTRIRHLGNVKYIIYYVVSISGYQ